MVGVRESAFHPPRIPLAGGISAGGGMSDAILAPSSYAFSLYALPTFLTACAVLVLGAWVVLRERGAALSWLFFLVTLSIGTWLFAFSWMYAAQSEAVALWWARAAYLGVPLIPSTIFHFAAACLGLSGPLKRWVRLSWLLSLFFMIAILGTDELIGGLYHYWWGYYPRYGWLSGPYLIFFFGVMVASLRLFWVEYGKARPGTIPARRLRAFLLAFGVAYLGSVDYLAKYGVAVYPFGYIPILVFLVLSARLLRRYPLSDLAPQFAESQIVAFLQDALFVCDIHGIIRVVNQATGRLLGYKEQELLGRPLDGLVEETAEARVRLHEMLREIPFHDREAAWVTRAGASVEVSLSAASLKDARGLPVGTIILARDIHDRKEAEQERAALASFPETNPNPVLEVTPDGELSYLNPAGKRLFPDLERNGRQHPLLQAMSSVSPVMQQGQKETMVREVHVGKQVYEEHIHRVPQSALLRIYVVDATDRKRYEQSMQAQGRELLQVNEELNTRERRMRRLLEDLQQARERLETQSRALEAANARLRELASLKDDLVAKVSHELRTPLTSVKEGLSLLMDNALGETTADQQDFLKTMDADVDRLTELINNLLDLSKIEAGRMRLARTRLDVREMVQLLLNTYQPILKNRTLRTELADVPPVFADRNRMMQVLTNLLSNAIKFTPEGGTITLRAGSHDSTVSLSIEDSGDGIAPEDLSKLFQKFSQVGPSGKSQSAGTGLGLVICKELTELHKGRIEVTSEVGRGTTFKVLLPVYTDSFAMGENLRELIDVAKADEDEQVGLIAIDAGPWVEQQPEAARREALERLAETVRRNVHRGDSVLTVRGSHVVVLAVAPPQGLQAVIRRLRQAVAELSSLRMGTAVYPQDGEDAGMLFEHAQHLVAQGQEANESGGRS